MLNAVVGEADFFAESPCAPCKTALTLKNGNPEKRPNTRRNHEHFGKPVRSGSKICMVRAGTFPRSGGTPFPDLPAKVRGFTLIQGVQLLGSIATTADRRVRGCIRKSFRNSPT